MKKTPEKRYIVRKYVMAQSAAQALKREKKVMPCDVFVDDDWMKANPQHHSRKVGY
jgi:hypothetical protein